MNYQDTGLCEDIARHTFWKVNDGYKAFALEFAQFLNVPAGVEIRTDDWRKLEHQIGLGVFRRNATKVLDECLRYEALAEKQFDNLRRLYGQRKPATTAKVKEVVDDWD